MSTEHKSVHGVWASRWIFILAATGSAVGLGNIWKFPYIAGENGGGAFVLVYLVCIALIGVPIMVAEVLIGRRGRLSPANAVEKVAKESKLSTKWKSLGWMGMITGFLILSFYSVVAGWALQYTYLLFSGTFDGVTAEAVSERWGEVNSDPKGLLLWHSLFMVMTIAVVARGVNKGLEAMVRILMPVLFVLLLVMLGYAMKEGAFMAAVEFMFRPDFGKLNADSILVAMGHSFFTLSLGMGAIMAYGAYMPHKASIGSTVVTVALLDTVVALVAGLAIFPVVFANDLMASGGPGLLFQSLPLAFGHLPGGAIFGGIFFLLVSFAAWSSAISLAEPAVAWAVEKGYQRWAVALVIGIVCWVLGVGSVLSFNEWADVKVIAWDANHWQLFLSSADWAVFQAGAEGEAAGQTIFDFLDYLTTNILLPLGGFLIAVFVGWKMKETKIMKELAMKNMPVYLVWRVAVRIVAPLSVLVIFASKLGWI